MPSFVGSGDLTSSKPYIPPASIQIEVVETTPGIRTKRIGVYGRTRYGRCIYGTQSGVYGKDKYNQATYE